MGPEWDAAEIYSLIAFSEKENSISRKTLQIEKMWYPTKNGLVTQNTFLSVPVRNSGGKEMWA